MDLFVGGCTAYQLSFEKVRANLWLVRLKYIIVMYLQSSVPFV